MLTGEYKNIVQGIIEKDKAQFKKLNDDYIKNPIRESETALDMLYTDSQWKSHWDYFLEQMVYDEIKPSYEKAYARLQLMSQEIFEILN